MWFDYTSIICISVLSTKRMDQVGPVQRFLPRHSLRITKTYFVFILCVWCWARIKQIQRRIMYSPIHLWQDLHQPPLDRYLLEVSSVFQQQHQLQPIGVPASPVPSKNMRFISKRFIPQRSSMNFFRNLQGLERKCTCKLTELGRSGSKKTARNTRSIVAWSLCSSNCGNKGMLRISIGGWRC